MSEPEECSMNKHDDYDDDRVPRELPGELKAFEARLAALSPRDDRLNRERLMFLAGHASAEAAFAGPGLPSRAREMAWPAAFTAMTAIAATLLVMLVARPVVNKMPAVHVADGGRRAPVARPSIAEPTDFNTSVLSTGDARRHDIEQLLSVVTLAASGDAASPSVSEGDGVPLTPAAWREIIDSAEATRPRSSDSSDIDIRMNQGITS